MVGSAKGYAECLQLVLDCLPTDDHKQAGVASRGLLSLPVLADPSQRAVLMLRRRGEQINAALTSIPVQSGEAQRVDLQSEWAARRASTQAVVNELGSKFVQTNLR